MPETLAPKTTLEGFRARIDHRVAEPEHLTRSQFDALDVEAQTAHDNARLRWVGSGMVVNTPHSTALVVRSVRAHLRTSDPLTIGESGLVITGPAHIGKTTALWNVAAMVERGAAKNNPMYRSHGVVPVVYIEVPPKATPKSMASQIVDFFGLPYNRRTTTQEQIVSMAVDVLHRHQTRVLIIDELQMLQLGGSGGDSAIIVLKTLMNSTGCLMVFAGIDLMTELPSRAAEQIVSRCEVLQMLPYNAGSDEARGHWARLVAQFESQMHLLDVDEGHLGPFADRLLAHSNGRIGGLRRTLTRAMSTAIDERDENGGEFISEDMLFGFQGFSVPAAAAPEAPAGDADAEPKRASSEAKKSA